VVEVVGRDPAPDAQVAKDEDVEVGRAPSAEGSATPEQEVVKVVDEEVGRDPSAEGSATPR